MSKQRDELIWDEAYSYGVNQGKQAGLEIAQKQLEKVFKSAYDIISIELRILREHDFTREQKFYGDLHDIYRGMADE